MQRSLPESQEVDKKGRAKDRHETQKQTGMEYLDCVVLKEPLQAQRCLHLSQ